MIVVPNHLVEQWGAAFLALYPQANIFVAGKDCFARRQPPEGDGAHRHRKLRRGHRLAQILRAAAGIRCDSLTRFVDKQIEQLEEAMYEAKAEKGDNRRIVKELEKAKKRLEAKLKERADRENKDNTRDLRGAGRGPDFCR